MARDVFRLHEVLVTPEGGVRVVWSPLEGALEYTVVLVDGEQGEAGRLEAGHETTQVLDQATLAGLATRPTPWFVRVEARDEDDTLARTSPLVLPPSVGRPVPASGEE